MLEEKVFKIFPRGAMRTLDVLALKPRILNVVDEVPCCIYYLLIVVAIGIWLGVKYLVTSADKLEVFLMWLALVLQGL